MPDMAWRRKKAGEYTDASHHRRRPQHRCQLLRRFHPVLERDGTGRWADQRADGCRHLWHLPGFHSDEDDIHDADLPWVVRGLHGVEDKVAAHAVHPQPLGL
jgi:hypothetical protein